MGRTAAVAGTVALALSVLAGCGGEKSPYCEAVEADQKTLDSFGADKSDAGFGTYAKALAEIAELAPASSKKAWTALSGATQGVVDAHAAVGFKLEDMDDQKKREGLSAGDVESLNAAYKAFNGTTDQRKAVVADVKKTCDITLK